MEGGKLQQPQIRTLHVARLPSLVGADCREYFFWDESLRLPFLAVGDDVLVDIGADKPA